MAAPEAVVRVQEEFGYERSAMALEAFFASVARLAVAAGVTRYITAGGETSGAVVRGLGLNSWRSGRKLILALLTSRLVPIWSLP